MVLKKKVVHMTTVHYPYDTRIYHKECKSLKQAGFDVTLIAPETDEQGNGPIPIIPIKKYKNRLFRMVGSTFQAYKQAKKLQADYYHIHDPELLPVAWALKNRTNTVVYDIHEDYITSIMQKEYIPRPIRKLIANAYRLVENLFSKHLELCLAEKYYQDKYPRGKCILNYPTINQKLINNEIGKEDMSNSLLYTGNVSIDRGALIHAKIPLINNDLSVHYVGKCPEQLADKIVHTAGDRSDNITIDGINRFIEREEIDNTYISKRWIAGLALFPPTEHYMKKELTKFFEYMSAGIPIICSNFPVWKNFIEKYQCGIAVDPYDKEAINHAIDFIKANPDRAKQMGENGRQAVLDHLNWQLEEEKLVEWYKDIAAL